MDLDDRWCVCPNFGWLIFDLKPKEVKQHLGLVTLGLERPSSPPSSHVTSMQRSGKIFCNGWPQRMGIYFLPPQREQKEIKFNVIFSRNVIGSPKNHQPCN